MHTEARNGRDRDEVVRRDARGGLTYKVNHDARVSGSWAIAPPKAAPVQQSAWWEWVKTHVDREIDALREATGQALAMKAGEVRAALSAEIDLIKRQVAQLRAEFDADRGIKALQAEIAAARASVPKLPAIAADLEAEQAAMRKEIARLTRELTAAQTRITNVHVELSQTRYDLSKLESKTPKPVVTVTLSTPQSSFVVRDDDPGASAAWQRFLENVVQSNPAAEGRVNGSATN